MKFANALIPLILLGGIAIAATAASAQSLLKEAPKQDTALESHALRGGVTENGFVPALELYAPWGFKCVRAGKTELPARVTEVVPDSPAFKAGLAQNDKIVNVVKQQTGFSLRVERAGKLYFAKMGGQTDRATLQSPPAHQTVLINCYEVNAGGYGTAKTKFSVTPDGSMQYDGTLLLKPQFDTLFRQYMIPDETHCYYSNAGTRSELVNRKPQYHGQLHSPAIFRLASILRSEYPQANTIIIEDTNIHIGGCNTVDFELETPRFKQFETGAVAVIEHCRIALGGSNSCSFKQSSAYAHAPAVSRYFTYDIGQCHDCHYSFDYDSGTLDRACLRKTERTPYLPREFEVIEPAFWAEPANH